jgi:hypothetical protein
MPSICMAYDNLRYTGYTTYICKAYALHMHGERFLVDIKYEKYTSFICKSNVWHMPQAGIRI